MRALHAGPQKKCEFLRRWETLKGFSFCSFAFLCFEGQALCTLAGLLAREEIKVFAFTRKSFKTFAVEGVYMLLSIHPIHMYMFALHSFPITYIHRHSLPLHVLAIKVFPLHPFAFKVLALAFTFHDHPLSLIRHRRWHS